MSTPRVLGAVALAAAGIATSVAIAGPPPGKGGPPPGKGKDKQAATTSAQTSTDGASTTSTAGRPSGKLVLCHRTHSAKKPFVKIRVNEKAAAAHRRHGDVEPDASGSCPRADTTPGGTTTGATTTGTTTATTPSP